MDACGSLTAEFTLKTEKRSLLVLMVFHQALHYPEVRLHPSYRQNHDVLEKKLPRKTIYIRLRKKQSGTFYVLNH